MEALTSKAITRTRRRLMLTLTRAGMVATGSSLALQLVGSAISGQRFAMGAAILGSSLLGAAAALFASGRRPRHGRVLVSDRVLRIGAERDVDDLHELGALETGHVEVDEKGRTRLVLSTAALRYEVEVDDADAAERLLAATGLDARHRAIRFDRRESGSDITKAFLAVSISVWTVLLPYWVMGFEDVARSPLLWLFATCGTLLGVASGITIGEAIEPSPIEVGADGVRWIGWFKSKHFVRYRELKDVVLEGRTLRLVTHAKTHTVDLGDTPPTGRDAVKRRIETAWFADVPHAPLELLARRGRDLATWKATLAELVSEGQESYRQAKIPRVRVEATLEDPDAPADQRLGAAIALASTGTDQQRDAARRRAAELAKSVVDPSLAQAFVEVAHDRLARTVAERVGESS